MSSAPHPFSLRQLQYAVAVSESLSFRRAALQCHVSQPSLSAQLAQLEAALGVRLFERDRRHVLLSPGGKRLIERAREILLQSDDLLLAAKTAADPLSGRLTLGVIPTISPYLLPSIAPALRRSFPQLTLVWVEERTATLVSELNAGVLDAALLAIEAEIGQVESEVIAVDPFVLAVAATHPLAKVSRPARAAELRDEEVLLLEEGHCFREQALAFCGRARARELEFRATSLPTLIQMVAGGAGVTLLPSLAVAREAHVGGLRIRRLAQPVPHRTVALVWRPRSPLGPALRQMAAVLRAAYPKGE